ncbi:LytTR family DNA-binding domain-containing protein [Bacteroides helcogenes]|uniref:Two component transcriptional regulator, LytTR family n=1 Tax=Bacteroides helcogenes (strain ATCC 35417 / DSM 20613 / JCM 6297 / CCUG 15421 / P 36-108) TaxID=693979 RepID=E6SQY8_BACT6|nr:LytTR family DNA-binding domain-containing protein [Bacteroides helcogenes]ADV45057.1 two component transcriptional regulator, LytTR family [Bacteroides helcogenes P 36-108]MDY5239915.1 LytTR family DNA-binding domain-containing protein [Bacteroides helcogenes]
MINCIAIDDEPLALTQLTEYISRIPYLNLVASCHDAFSAMKALSVERVDLLFIDINMPDLNGLEFVRSLTECPMVVFTTAYSEYAVDGFKVDAVDYLLKPFSFQDLLMATEKARRRLEHSLEEGGEESLFVKSDYRVTRVRLNDIKYIEGMSEYVRIYVEGEPKPLMPLLSMKRLEEVLPPSQFMRVHRSYIVNLRKIAEISRLRIVFGETYIPVGDIYKDKFLEYVNGRMMK